MQVNADDPGDDLHRNRMMERSSNQADFALGEPGTAAAARMQTPVPHLSRSVPKSWMLAMVTLPGW